MYLPLVNLYMITELYFKDNFVVVKATDKKKGHYNQGWQSVQKSGDGGTIRP